MRRKYKIVLVDDHAVFREGLSFILQQENDLLVCGTFADALTALRQAPALHPNLAIIDISMEGMDGLELTKNLRIHLPAMAILILSMHKEFLYAERALRAGANGYIMKQQSGRELMKAIRTVLKGETYVSPAVNERILQNMTLNYPASPVERLSDREFEVFQWIGRGYVTRQIAATLNVSAKTVDTHRERIREKLSVHSAFELVQYAHEWVASQHK